MAQVAGAGAGDGIGGDRRRRCACFPLLRMFAFDIPTRAWGSFQTVIQVHLGDGVSRAKPGERLEHTDMDSARHWIDSYPDADTPAHPPKLAPGKTWRFIGTGRDGVTLGDMVEKRKFKRISEDAVLVLREGIAFPTRELLVAVNTAHAVLVLRGRYELFYLRDDFVLSADEERALVGWGAGRSLFANSLLAVGGTILVAFVEKVWGPAVVGTLLVATAGYRAEGILTKVLRVRSAEWKSKYKLVPSGIHGTERMVQGVLVTLVALADLLGDRLFLLVALTLASVQVVLVEYVGQIRLALGRERYHALLCVQLGVWTCYCAALVLWLWLSSVFAEFLGCIFVGGLLGLLLLCVVRCDDTSRWFVLPSVLVGLGSVGVGIWATVLGWDDVNLTSPQSGTFDRFDCDLDFDCFRVGSFSTGMRALGLWCSVAGGGMITAYITVGVFLFRINSDGFLFGGSGERTRERKKKDSPGFSHYDEKPIPSRHLLVPNVGQQTLDVGQQTLECFWTNVDVGQQAPDVGQQPAPFSSIV